MGLLGDQAMECLGPERMMGAFPLKTYLREGIRLIDGTDAPGYWPVDVLRDVGFCVTRRDPFTVPPERIGDIQVDYTVVGGRIVYERRE